MFSFLQNIFGATETQHTHYPESLISEAIERALDGTDPRMRILSGHPKILRPAVIHAIDHVIALVHALEPPVTLSTAGRDASPVLAAVFTSSTRMEEIISTDNHLRAYREEKNPVSTLTAMLAVQRKEKSGFGYGLVDDRLVSDLQQTTVSFDEHRLMDVSDSEKETRRLLMRRAFDYLLSLALAQVTEQRDEREHLSQQRALLRAKQDVIRHSSNSFFSHPEPASAQEHSLQEKLQEIESRLTELGPVDEILKNNLALVATVLEAAEKHLWLEQVSLRLDQHYVLHDTADSSVPLLTLQDICASNGQRITALLVSI